jgi:hypothetical protein
MLHRENRKERMKKILLVTSALTGSGHKSISDALAEQFSGLCSVTYSPAMIQTAIQDMVDFLNGEEVEQDHVIACENVTAENVDEYPSF